MHPSTTPPLSSVRHSSCAAAGSRSQSTCVALFGVDYTPTYIGGEGTGVIYWINQGEVMWKLSDTAMAANNESEVSARPVSGEPMR